MELDVQGSVQRRPVFESVFPIEFLNAYDGKT